jgi:hypothetical protein
MVSRLRRWLDAESEATGLPLAAMLASAVAIHVWVTLLAFNPWHPDEHFQILEFAWARAGLSPFADLPWEWNARIRPTLQPSMALGLLTALRAVGLDSPFVWVLLLRLASLATALAVLLGVVRHASPALSRAGRQTLWMTTLLLWFLPLFLARFSSENLGGLTLALAIVLVERARPGRRHEAGAGILLGLSFLFRYQMAFAIVPVLAWVALRGEAGERRAWGRAASMALVAAGVVAAGAVVDAWFYGEWVFTPLNYFRVNLLEGKAAYFGTSPWHFYLTHTPVLMAPPLGIALFALAVAGAAFRPRSPWSWAAAAFLAGHSLVSHKEDRFLLPLVYTLPLLTAWGVEAAAKLGDAAEAVRTGRGTAPSRRSRRVALLRAGAWAMVIQNGLLLALATTPSIHHGKDLDGHYMRFLWATAEGQPGDTVYVLHDTGDAYRTHGLTVHVFRHPRVRSVLHRPGDPLPAGVRPGTPASRLLVESYGDAPPSVAGARAYARVYVAEPGYRIMARAMGQEGAPWLPWLEDVNLWTDPGRARRLWRVHLDGGA